MADGHRPEKVWRREARRGDGPYIRAFALLTILTVQIGLTLGGIEPPWRPDWFDLMQRVFPRVGFVDLADSPVRIVAIQNNDDGEADQLAWPRDRIARVVDRIATAEPKAIGLDLQLDGQGIFEIAELASGSVSGPDRTLFLADVITDRPVVLPILLYEPGALRPPNIRRALDPELDFPPPSEETRRAAQEFAKLFPRAPELTGLLGAHPALRRAARAEGIALDEIGGQEITRSVPMARIVTPQDVGPRRFFSLPAEMLKIGEGARTIDYRPEGIGSVRMHIGDEIAIPLDPSGDARLYLRPLDPRIYIDGNAVFHGRFDPEFFRDKYVIVSKAYGGFDGVIDTAIFQTAMTAEPLAQVIEQALSNSYLSRPGWVVWAEIGLTALLGLFIIKVFPLWIPSIATPIVIAVVLVSLPVSIAAFVWFGLAVDGLGTTQALLVLGAIAFGSTLVDRDRQHQEVQLALLEERAEKSRLEGELDVARRIQMGLLPPAQAKPVPDIEIACHIHPARTVGGDFYDHVTRADGRFFFLIADVSGKGVPASLFMALAKSQWKSAALRRETLGQIQSLANREISRDNKDAMFVTGVACLFDPADNSLSYCGAGHDMPILARRGCRAITLPEASGPPMGIETNFPYAEGQIRLEAGDLFCLFTDGLTEAELRPGMHRQSEQGIALFGAEGIAAALEQAADANLSAAGAIQHVLDLLESTTIEGEHADDRTIVVVRALGTPCSQSAR